MRIWPGPALAIALAILVVGACRREGPPVLDYGRIVVSEAEVAAHPSLGQGAEDLRKRVELALARSGRFRLVPGAERPERLPAVTLRLAAAAIFPDPENALGFRAAVALELGLSAERPLTATGRGEAPFPPGDLDARGAAFVAAFGRALEEAVAGLVAMGDAEASPDERLVSELAADEPVRRGAALRLLVERKSKAAVEPLLGRLADPDPEEVLRAATALAAIGDDRAVQPLIDVASRRDPAFVARIATALGDLGGPDAEAYLFTAAGGHPDPGVRAAAEDALATLRANRRRAGADRPGAP